MHYNINVCSKCTQGEKEGGGGGKSIVKIEKVVEVYDALVKFNGKLFNIVKNFPSMNFLFHSQQRVSLDY